MDGWVDYMLRKLKQIRRHQRGYFLGGGEKNGWLVALRETDGIRIRNSPPGGRSEKKVFPAYQTPRRERAPRLESPRGPTGRATLLTWRETRGPGNATSASAW